MGCCLTVGIMDITFTKENLKIIVPGNKYIDHWFDALTMILPDYDITTSLRLAAFLAQTAHESMGFSAIKENLNYRAETLRKVFPKYFPDAAMASKYAHKQEAIANKVYANRMGNGSEASGDGFSYRGRGLIQITGKTNYTKFAASIDTPLADVQEYLATFEGAVQSACWFWEVNKLNTLADNCDIIGLTKKINGGTNGIAERVKLYQTAMRVLSSSQ